MRPAVVGMQGVEEERGVYPRECTKHTRAPRGLARLGGGYVAADLCAAAPVDEAHPSTLGVGEGSAIVTHRGEEEEGAHLLGAGAGAGV